MSDQKENKVSIIPEKKTWLRAIVSAIPTVGGALDHLLFDRADEIRARNIEESLKTIEKKLSNIPEAILDKAWFESEEALAMFRNMAEKVEFEPDRQKRTSLANVVAISGTKIFSSDKRKLSVFEHLNRLTFVQMRLLSIIGELKPEQKQVGQEIVQTVNALWANQIIQAIRQNRYGQFWEGQLNIGLELEILESLNMISGVQTIAGGEKAFVMTSLGQEAVKYFKAGNN
jgi:hypothetical protein